MGHSPDDRHQNQPESASSHSIPETRHDTEHTASSSKRRREHDDSLKLPTLIVPQTLLLPHMSLPYPVEGEEESQVIDYAIQHDRLVLVLAVVDQEDEPDFADFDDEEEIDEEEILNEHLRQSTDSFGLGFNDDELCTVGVIAEVGHKISRPGVPAHVVLQGVARGIVQQFDQRSPFTLARVTRSDDVADETMESRAVMANVMDQVESYVEMLPNVPEEVVAMVRSVEEPGWLADLIAFSPEFNPTTRQELLEILNPIDRLKRLSTLLNERLEFMALRQQIQNEAQAGMDRHQREVLLREQLRHIQRELGDLGDEDELTANFREKIESEELPEDVRAKALYQLNRLEQQHPFSPEIGVIHSYLEWLTELPWSEETEDQVDLEAAAQVLDEDHHGLEKVKERILEFIAVRKLAGSKMRSPILCFVGPPGVGKTSLGRSIARALGREYARMSLGGVRDEAEIRGHRRTYVGAMPGRVIKAIREAGTRNPVLVLDEIDKVGSDTFRGDPSSALLEVLDPEQNTTFSDHYLEVPFDLSQVVFITTANLLDPIPPALRDRMEIIEVPSYTEVEKLEIAKHFLIPKAIESHGLTEDQARFGDEALLTIIREYTDEAGVRNLEREIGSICRKVARAVASETEDLPPIESANDVKKLLGIPRYEYGLASEEDEVGVATGAAVTTAGGDLLSIEVTIMSGKNDLVLTGQLGDVMQESARAAISYCRSVADGLGIAGDFFDKHTIHIHVPAGAVPKDGPSAGITMAVALISALTGVPVRKDVAMTGEITLRGKVLPIGGLREKALAARRGMIGTFIAPRRNEKDLEDIPQIVRDALDIHLVDRIDDALELALTGSLSEINEPAVV
ncbi:MAG: endopeptidase La [Chloroflexota bacterium]